MNPYSSAHFHLIEKVIALIEGGKTNEEIAALTHLSPSGVNKYRSARGPHLRNHERRRSIRDQYLEGRSIRRLSKAFETEYRSIEALVSDIARPEDQAVPAPCLAAQVVLNLNGEQIRIQPTGRMELCTSFTHPEKQWMFEAIDTRDGYPKMYALTDIQQPENSFADAA